MKQKFIEILKSTNRKGMDNVLAKLEELGFYEAPASTKFHLSYKGGLLEHSMNVYSAALVLSEQAINWYSVQDRYKDSLSKGEKVVMRVNLEMADKLPDDSIAICTLLHDVCKADIYKEAMLNRKNDAGFWEKYQGYAVDYEAGMPLGHGEKSVIMLLSWGLELKPEEMLAIRWHMTAWDLPMQSPEHKSSLDAAKKKTPLVSLIQLSDGFASGLVER